MEEIKRKKMSAAAKDQLWGYLFVAPWVLGFLIFTLYPMVFSFGLSFFEWDLFSEPIFVALGNYKNIFSSSVFMASLINTLIYTVFSSVISVVFGLLIAYALIKKSALNITLRTVLYLPCLVIGIAFAMMMTPIFDGSVYGFINQIFDLLGLPLQSWLAVRGQAVWVLVAMTLWGLGSPMIIFIAGFKNIDKSYMEAAEIDGASKIQTLLRISIPLLIPIIIYQSIMGIISGMQIFDLAMGLATASGNSLGMGLDNALATLVYYLYNVGFRDSQFGAGSAIGWIIFMITIVFSLGLLFFVKKTKYYTVD